MQKMAKEIARIVQEGKGADTVLLDVSQLNGWTDFFVIATVNSNAHFEGIFKQIKEWAKKNGLEIRTPRIKISSGDEWNLVDFGSIVVHLMSKDAREFYDLEKLWHKGLRLEF